MIYVLDWIFDLERNLSEDSWGKMEKREGEMRSPSCQFIVRNPLLVCCLRLLAIITSDSGEVGAIRKMTRTWVDFFFVQVRVGESM